MYRNFRTKDWDKLMLKVFIGLVLFVGFVGGCTLTNKKMGLKDDNPIEEAIEDLIEQKTGLDIDLTPGSVED